MGTKRKVSKFDSWVPGSTLYGRVFLGKAFPRPGENRCLYVWMRCAQCCTMTRVRATIVARGATCPCTRARPRGRDRLRFSAAAVWCELKAKNSLGPEWLENREAFIEFWTSRKNGEGATYALARYDPALPHSPSNTYLKLTRPGYQGKARQLEKEHGRDLSKFQWNEDPSEVLTALARDLGISVPEAIDELVSYSGSSQLPDLAQGVTLQIERAASAN